MTDRPALNTMWPKVLLWKQRRRWGSFRKMRTPVSNVHEMKIAMEKIVALRDIGQAEIIGVKQ